METQGTKPHCWPAAEPDSARASSSCTHTLGLQVVLPPVRPSQAHDRGATHADMPKCMADALHSPCPGEQGQCSCLLMEDKASAEVVGCLRKINPSLLYSSAVAVSSQEPRFPATLHPGVVVWQPYHPTPGSPKPPTEHPSSLSGWNDQGHTLRMKAPLMT